VGAPLTSLPSRRFREAQLLIGAALVMLVAMVVVEMVGMLAVARLVEEEARRASMAAAQLFASRIAGGESARFVAALRQERWGVVLFGDGRVLERVGEAGPSEPAWWPWSSRAEWERAGERVAGPLPAGGGRVLVAYQPLADGRVVRAVVPISGAGAAARLRWVGASLAVVVAMGGGLLAWALIARVLAPYRELLAEASRVTRGPAEGAEDRFLVETFRETVRRLEVSEAALRRRADDLEALAEVLTRGSAAGVVITDPRRRVVAANTAAAELVPTLTVGGALPAALAGAAASTRLGGRILEVRRLPLLATTGNAQGEVLFLTDRTSVEALERALAEHEQMAALGELAAGMTHELRNALATIRGYLRLLPDAQRDERARFVAAINDEAEGLAELLDRFLRFAQPRELRREPVEVLDLVGEAATKVRAAFPGVAVAVEGGAATVFGDALALGVVIENLVRNAAEAVSPQAGAVSARVETSAGVVRVVIEDDGPGVSEDLKARLFVPFASSKPSGGLGLALARRFARLHGGDVEYEPRPGGGSRFLVWLPRQGVT
jgi:signal transduction histidine kinase